MDRGGSHSTDKQPVIKQGWKNGVDPIIISHNRKMDRMTVTASKYCEIYGHDNNEYITVIVQQYIKLKK